MLRDQLRANRARAKAIVRPYVHRFADLVADRVAHRLGPAAPPAAPPAPDPAPPADPLGEGNFTLAVDFPVSPRSRYGFGRPPHPALTELLAAGAGRYEAELAAWTDLFDRVATIPVRPGDDGRSAQPHWVNGWIPGLDGLALYAFTALRRPATYLEVGSGNSTRFVRRAIGDGGLATRIVSIDPEPRAEVDAICDEVIRRPLESTDLAVFDRLGAGDVVYVDGSHRCFQNSDATVMFTEVLPRLAPGVRIGFHDIFLPDDYPPEWDYRLYSEQYLLAAFLLGGHRGYEVVLPSWYAAHHEKLAAIVAPLFDRPGLEEVERHGSAFWLERTAVG
jgi:hypothetical protein